MAYITATYAEETSRLEQLAKFACTLAPSSAQSIEAVGRQVDDETDPRVIDARDRAIVEALDAVTRIARDSHVPASPKPRPTKKAHAPAV